LVLFEFVAVILCVYQFIDAGLCGKRQNIEEVQKSNEDDDE
jgi:hypothetical protein